MVNRYDPRKEFAAIADHLRRDAQTVGKLAVSADRYAVQAQALMEEAAALLAQAAGDHPSRVERFGR